MLGFRYKILRIIGKALKLGKSDIRVDLEANLQMAVEEIKAQMENLTVLRVTGMYNHHSKLAQSTASLTASLVKALAELRQQEKHKQRVFDAMDDDELDTALAGHFHDISAERREFFREVLDSLESVRGVLG